MDGLAVSGPGLEDAVEIIFVVDNSGSMASLKTQMTNNVTKLLETLSTTGKRLYLGLCRFGGEEQNGAAIIENNGIFVSLKSIFLDDIWIKILPMYTMRLI